MKIQDPARHQGNVMVSPNVAQSRKPNAGAGVVPPLPGEADDTRPGASPSPIAALELELEGLLATWLPRLEGLFLELRRQPYAVRLETMVLALTQREHVATEDLVLTAAMLLEAIDQRADALERAEHTTPAPTSGPEADEVFGDELEGGPAAQHL